MNADIPSDQHKHQWLALAIVSLTAIIVGGLMLFTINYAMQSALLVGSGNQTPSAEPAPTETPQFKVETVLGGLRNPWDTGFLPDGQTLVTQRGGTLSVLRDRAAVQIAKIDDVFVQGEGGLLGLAVDPNFVANRYIYTCFDSKDGRGAPRDVRIVRWKVNDAVTALSARQDIVTGMPINSSGRHSGCRLAFGPDGYLWAGTGDAAQASVAQDPKSLGGKILRIDRDGKAAPGNVGGNFDARIYSYGHRNTQGLAFAPRAVNGILGFSVEHGSTVDDEVNMLVTGNFGWSPDPGYTELGVPMTDKSKFPQAIDAVWSSGDPTQAPSGANFITGTQWKGWNGALAIAALKGQHLKVLRFDENAKVIKEEKVLITYGRLRSVREGPDGDLYVTTDNGTDDKVLKLIAQ